MSVKNNYFWLGENAELGFIANGDVLKVHRVYNLESKYGFKFADIEFAFNDDDQERIFSCKINLGSLMIDGPSLPSHLLRKLFLEIERDNLYINNRKDRKLAIFNSPYYQALQVKFAYALTCHKAQGGQWSSVFLDQGYLPEQSVDKELLRWMYTSFTRAIDQLYLLNFHSLFQIMINILANKGIPIFNSLITVKHKIYCSYFNYIAEYKSKLKWSQ